MTDTNPKNLMLKTCPVCGVKFECDSSFSCWCISPVYSSDIHRAVREKLDICLCQACLEREKGKINEKLEK
ncbi:MAG: cysteine-rich CWC family protein [Bacteroidetes bacterium]|nr:cysteine-rich CWC family protein [Bacteroidota bacterium]